MSAVFFIAANNYVDKKYKDFFITELDSDKKIVTYNIINLYSSGNISAVQKAVTEYGKMMNRRITLISLTGQVIADSQANPADMPNHSDRTEVKEAMQGKNAHNIRFSSTLNRKMLYSASMLEVNSKPAAVIRLSMPIDTINIFANEMRVTIFIIIIIMLCISVIIASFIAFSLSIKITNLKNASERLAGGDFSAKIETTPHSSKDEIDLLGDSFNKMSEQIEALFSKIKEDKLKLDRIMESVNDTIVVADKSGKIIMHNGAFEKHFKNINPDNRYFWEIFRDKKLEETIKNLSYDGNSVIFSEIEYENKIYALAASKIKTNDNSVLTFHDITTIKQMAAMKKEFVTNASHELKTPLTAISCFVENIETEDDIDAIKRYTAVIKKHSERLTKIVTDLLSLSELENNKNIELVKMDLAKTVFVAADLYKNRTEQKNIKLDFTKTGNSFFINGNEFYIEQMLVNLLDNALRYTEKGTITIKLESSPDKVILTVSDTGIGIAKEHLPRLFERFYVVDKARSRKSGGTGLGLSIVKYITNIHNALITIDSTVNEGTSVTVKFNRA